MAKMSEYLARGLVETQVSPEGFLLMLVRQPDGSYQTKVIESDNVGARGAQGETGGQGAPGVNGTNGQNGTNGTDGTNGTNGVAGATGATGATGAAGPAGSSTHSTLAYAASTDLDFNLADFRTVTLAGNITFTTSNKASIKFLTIRIVGDGSTRTFTFPAWKFIGAAAPASLAANKIAILSLTCYGAADTDIVAAYAAEP